LDAENGALGAISTRNEGVGSKMEPFRVCRLEVADLHHIDELQDPDALLSEKSDPDPVGTGTYLFSYIFLPSGLHELFRFCFLA
jgi:hypothetical protein